MKARKTEGEKERKGKRKTRFFYRMNEWPPSIQPADRPLKVVFSPVSPARGIVLGD